MEYDEIVKKLIGNIQPQGCANRDAESLENLENMIKLTETLLFEITAVYRRNNDSYEHSVRQHSEAAHKFLSTILPSYEL